MLRKDLPHDFIGTKFASKIPINSQFCNSSQTVSISYSILLYVPCHMLNQVIEVSKAIKVGEFRFILSELLLELKIRGG